MPSTPLVSALALAAAAVLPGPVGGGVGPEDRAGGLPRVKVVDGGIPSLVYLPPAGSTPGANGTLLAVGQAGHSGPDRLLLCTGPTRWAKRGSR